MAEQSFACHQKCVRLKQEVAILGGLVFGREGGPSSKYSIHSIQHQATRLCRFFSSYHYSLILLPGPFHYLTELPYLGFVLSVSLFITADVDNQLYTRVYPLPCAALPLIAAALYCAYARYHALACS